ncbi:MAG: PH domain-containing protein [Mycobacterium sp.]
MTGDAAAWRRLSPRMLLVHPVHEVARQLPVLIGSVVLGSATGSPMWSLAVLGALSAFGVARWFTTGYRIDDVNVQLRTGVLRRAVLTLPRSRIRSVETDARLLHRVLGLTVLRVSTGREATGENAFELDAVETGQVRVLRAALLAESMPSEGGEQAPEPGRQLAAWQPSWLRYSPLSFSGLVTIAAAFGLIYQAGLGQALERIVVTQSRLDAAQSFGVVATAAALVVLLLAASVALSVGRSLLTYANLVLRRDGELLHLQHGLTRVREHTYDMRRLRGGTICRPLLVRVLGGARLDAMMTGVGGEGAASLLLPPCPAATTTSVLTDLVGDADVVSGVLVRHGPAAARRRWTRALTLPAVLGVALAALAATAGAPCWLWVLWAALTGCCALLAADRARALGHRVFPGPRGWLVARAGSLTQRRDCLATAGIVGWSVQRSFFQRRVGVATLVAATASGRKYYSVIDVDEAQAWSIAAQCTAWVADPQWCAGQEHSGPGSVPAG